MANPNNSEPGLMLNASEQESRVPAQRTKARLVGWVIVGVVGAAVLASFAIMPQEEDNRRGRGEHAVPVAAVVVERDTLTEQTRYPGELDADTADVSSFYTGRLNAVHVRVGDLVAKGDVLAEIDPVDAREQIAQAKAQAEAAAAEEKRVEVELAAAEKQLARYEEIREHLSVSDFDKQKALTESLQATLASASARRAEALAGLRLLEKRVAESVIRAPFAGRIAARYADPGVIVNAGVPLVRVVATSPLWVRFEVPEQEVVGLTVGANLRITTQANTPDAASSVAARITGIGGEVSRDRRVATVEAVIDNPPAGWLPGMFAEVIVERRTIEAATVVPSNAVLSRLQSAGVLATGVLIADGDVARWVPVTVVARDGDRVAVESPDEMLVPGARVLVAGHVDLPDGSRIQITEDATAEKL